MHKIVLAVLSLACLCVCLLSAVLHFLGSLSAGSYRLIFDMASVGWFLLAALWARKTKKA